MSKHPNVKDIYDYIDQIAPFETAEPWDNVGLLIGSAYATVSKVLLALDITEEVVDEAIDGHFNLIITHHPIIFSGLKSITYEERVSSLLLKLIQHKISVIAAHTNLDRSFDYGINRMIADCFKLRDVEPLNAQHRFGVVGNLPETMPFNNFIEHTKAIFSIKTVKVANIDVNITNNNDTLIVDRLIRKVALSSGASSDYIEDALSVNADVFITADLKYHEAQKVIDSRLILVDVGHFESECIYMKPFKALLDAFATEKFYQLIVQVTASEKPIFMYF